MLNIYEIEALILADIEEFNKIYNTQTKLVIAPIDIPEPKELLKKESQGRYNESDNFAIFKKLNISQLKQNHEEFLNFIKRLEKQME